VSGDATRTPPSLTKAAAIRAVIEAAGAAPIVFTTGYTCRIARSIADRPNHLYMTGSMGLCAPLAAGMALATRAPAVAVDGDGSLLMNPAALVAAGALAPLPLVHVLLDDGAYASTGGQPTASRSVDLLGWVRACGYRRAHRVGHPAVLGRLVAAALRGPDGAPDGGPDGAPDGDPDGGLAAGAGPVFLYCPVPCTAEAPPGRVDADLAGHARRLTDHLRIRRNVLEGAPS
jgi:sulfopyruvate decarboxylase subunit beta